jgi:hypothetical protein
LRIHAEEIAAQEKTMEKPIESEATHEEFTLFGPTMPRSAKDVADFARGAFVREPGLFTVGLAGMVIALLSLIAVAVRGSFIPPEGKMLDAVTFTFGVGLFTLTIALLLPLAGYSQSARRRWRRAYYVFAVYGLVLEPLQAFRGLDPRFSEVGGSVDIVAGIVFGVTALFNTVLFVILGVRFFRADVLHDLTSLRLGIRYGAAAVMLSFGVGIVMSLTAGREMGDDGNLLVAHALGVHGIQFVPVVASLLVWAGTAQRATTYLHAAGIGWLLACTAALAQALVGRPPLKLSIFTGLMVAGLAVWGAALGYSLLSLRQVALRRTPPP